MKKLLHLLAGLTLGLMLATPIVFGARTLDVSGTGDIVQLLNNWNAIKENLLNDTNAFPSAGETTKNKVVTAGTAFGASTNYSFNLFDDFVQQTLTEADGPWIENAGGSASDPAIAVEERGVVTLTTGTGFGGEDTENSSSGANPSQIIAHLPMQADSTGLYFETRLHMDTAITQAMIIAGFTDSTSLELPFEVGSSDVATVTATDAVMFVYDTRATTGEWFALGVDSGTQASATGATGTAPAADTYQTLRIELDQNGTQAKFYIDGTLVKTLSGTVVTSNTNLYATVLAHSLTGNGLTPDARTLDIDYLSAGHKR